MHVADPTPQQETVAAWCAERAERRHIDAGNETPDPVIAILGTARAAALHPATISAQTCQKYRTIGFPDLRFSWDEPNEKLITVADRIAEIHRRTADWTYPGSERPGAAQVVFCDAGVPNPDGSPSVYSTLTDLLTERGIARSQIAWVHDVTDPNRRQPLWDQVRSGHTRVLIGSTMQMGVGVNIQTRLYAAHELTAPYRPDWLEQAEGRLIRQGNNNTTVEVHRYVTERTADANSWQILQRKAHFIAQAMSDPEQMTRDLRDESVATVAEEFATIAAIATGDQRHIELAALTAATTRLERAERAHHASRQRTGTSDRRRRTQHRPAHRPDRHHRHAPPARHRPRPHRATAAGDALERALHHAARRRHLRSRTRRRDPPGDPRHRHLDTDPRRPAAPRRRRTRPRPTDPQPPRPTPRRARRPSRADRTGPPPDRRRTRPARPGRVPPPRRAARDPATTRPAARRADAQARTGRARRRRRRPATSRRPPLIDAPVAVDVGHPVFGDRQPSTAERFAWAGAYDRYSPGVVVWGNRARGADAWAAAVNAFSLNPANWHPTRRHDIGQFHGVTLQARFDDTTVEIEPRHAYAKTGIYPTFTAEPGHVDPHRLSTWLDTMRTLAVTERNELRHHVQPHHSTSQQHPRFER